MQSAGESSRQKSRLMGIGLYIFIFALTYVFPLTIILVVPMALIFIIGGTYFAAKFGTLDYKGPVKDAVPDYDIAGLKDFYEKSILPDLKTLAERHKRFLERHNKSNSSLSSLPFFCGAAIGFYLLSLGTHGFIVFIIMAFSLFISLMMYGVFAKDKGEGIHFLREYKAATVEKLVHFINLGFSYSMEKCIPRPVFMESGLFGEAPTLYEGDDHVSGIIGDTKIEFSELNTSYVYTSSKGKRQGSIFKGIFFVADFNKNFQGKTVVLPDVAESIFGNVLGQGLQSVTKEGELVKLEDPEFEKYFVVYSTDQVEARYILSTSLMERMVKFREKAGVGGAFCASFVNSKIYIAFPHEGKIIKKIFNKTPGEFKGFFEPDLSRPIVDFETIREYYEDLRLMMGIVEELNLNTRIWSRQ